MSQVSAVIPILKCFTTAKIVFYGHYPDMLLAKRSSRLRRLYRAPLDWLEATSTAMADKVLVNSNFTKAAYSSTFPRLSRSHAELQVVYPAVQIPDDSELSQMHATWQTGAPVSLRLFQVLQIRLTPLMVRGRVSHSEHSVAS